VRWSTARTRRCRYHNSAGCWQYRALRSIGGRPRSRGGPYDHGVDRPPLSRPAVLRLASDGQPQTGPAADAVDGAGGDLPAAEHEQAGTSEQGLPEPSDIDTETVAIAVPVGELSGSDEALGVNVTGVGVEVPAEGVEVVADAAMICIG